jgi:archaellum component FlaF (FlaF/FlaG flagellin family)
MARTKKTSSAVEAVAGTIKPPISFKEFSKDPVKGLMFICIIAVGYLYVDIKMSNKDIQDRQNQKIEYLDTKVDILFNQLRKSDSALSAASSKINVLQELGKIK